MRVRKLNVCDGNGTAEIRRRSRRAAVRVSGRYLGTLTKTGGRWLIPGQPGSYRSPAEAAEALAEAA